MNGFSEFFKAFSKYEKICSELAHISESFQIHLEYIRIKSINKA